MAQGQARTDWMAVVREVGRASRLERLFRDVRGARYDPVREPAQLLYAGRLALGLDVDD